MELDNCIKYFTQNVSRYADESEKAAFSNLSRTAQRFVSDSNFERYINELWGKSFGVLVRQDWFVIDHFREMIKNPGSYYDRKRFEELKNSGLKCINEGRIDELRRIISELISIMKNASEDDRQLNVNIIRG